MSEAQVIQPAAWDPAADLEAAFVKLKRSRVSVQGPAARTWASAVGNPCDRQAFYSRTVPQEMRAAHSPELQAIFDLGNVIETYVIRQLEDAGGVTVHRELPLADLRAELSGKIDIVLRMPGWPRPLAGEIKGLNPHVAAGLKTVDDIRYHKQAWVRRYYDQLQTYLVLKGDELGFFALLNKSTGWIRFLTVPIDYDAGEAALAKGERIALHVVANEPPERNVSDDCQRCDFRAVCGPDVSYGPGIEILSDPELPILLARREELAVAAKEFKEIDDEIKDRLPREKKDWLVGGFLISRNEVPKKGYPVKPSVSFPTHIRRAAAPK